MCGFKPGDEVVHTHTIEYSPLIAASVVVGQTYTVLAVVPRVMMDRSIDDRHTLIELVEADWGGKLPGVRGAYRPEYFRKVLRRSSSLTVEAFLTIKPGQFEEPRRPKAPARKRERA